MQRRIVIDDDLRLAGDAKLTQSLLGEFGARHHRGQVGLGISEMSEIEEHRAGDMIGGVIGARVAFVLGQEIAGVEDAQVGIGEMIGEPCGADEGFHAARPSRGRQPRRAGRAFMSAPPYLHSAA